MIPLLSAAQPLPLLPYRPAPRPPGVRAGPDRPGERPGEEEGDVATERAPKTKKPRRYRVLLHNDDYTTMEFVVHVLMKFFRKSQAEANFLMLTVHQKGVGVAGVYPREVAETKVHEVTRYARESGQPLLITMEAE